MRRMRIAAVYRRPNASKPAPGHKVYPNLLRKLATMRPNQVWAIDITYILMARGFVSLAAAVDWFSQKVLALRLSITMDTAFCSEAVEAAMARHGKPETLYSDQGNQFTSVAFTDLLKEREIAISMDGDGATCVRRTALANDKIRGRSACWPTPACRKQELRSADRSTIPYNARRPHSSLDRQSPDEAYFNALSTSRW